MTHQPWDDVYKEQGHYFEEHHPDMPMIADRLVEKGAKCVLDLGSGTGRHVVYFAERGYDVYGLDNAETGIQLTREWLETRAMTAHLTLADLFQPLPYDDDFFDAVISIQVIHHAPIEAINGLIGELERVMKPGGLLFVTLAKLKNQAETFEQIAPNTYVPLDGKEKGLPHYYFPSADDLRSAFSGFDVEDVYIDAIKHYALIGRRQG